MDGMISLAPISTDAAAIGALLAKLNSKVAQERSPNALERVRGDLQRIVEMLDR